jgi:hypothetical protein
MHLLTTPKSCEKIRLSLENCEVEKDITGFIRDCGTGQEIPDPPKYINFARGDLNDTASEASEDENYSVAQFQRTINPAFRSSSPQPSTYESHHDPDNDLTVKMGHGQTFAPPNREITLTPQSGRQQGNAPPGYEPSQHGDIATVPHNEYPTDGMTMFCRTGPPSDLSSARPSSSDSRSEYSNPTSYSSHDPASGKQSPIKLNNPAAAQSMSPDKALQKKRSGFFSNSPFRRKSKHEKDIQTTPNLAPGSRSTWTPSSRTGGSQQSSPTKIGFKGPTLLGNDRQSGSPEPADPRANFQLNVGNNVFDVASPDRANKTIVKTATSQDELDPIAQALAELKGVGKQASVRMSVDRYTGIATPAPGAPPPLANPATSGAQRGTPPPSYNETPSPVKRLGAPQPAFTSAQMQQTTRKYTGQTQDMFGGSNSRPGTREGHNVPRATSPAPPRATSPRPGMGMYQSNQHRPTSPNPFSSNGRPRGQTQSAASSPTKRGSDQGYQPQYSRQNSPNDVRRAASPQPQFARQDRPASSGGMEMQLAHSAIDAYGGGNQRGQRPSQQGRPMSYYGGGSGGDMGGGGSQNGRSRSKSMADGRQCTRDGRPILHFGMYLFSLNFSFPPSMSY